VNKELYTDILRRLRDAEKWRTNTWFLLHDNALAHRLALVKDSLANKNMTTMEHTQHSPDLVPADFYLFPRLKSALKERRFCDVTDIIKEWDGRAEKAFTK
jgi:transposase